MVCCGNKSRFCVVALVLLGLLTIAGSSVAAPQKMYEGPERPANEIAIVRGATIEINLESCDDVKVTKLEISVLPGERIIGMSYRSSTSYSNDIAYRKFTAEAGHTYAIDRQMMTNMPNMYDVTITDLSTNKRVKSIPHITPTAAQQKLIMVEQKIKENPQNYNFWGLKGQLLLVLNKYEEALTAMDTCLSLSPNSALGWKQKSEALYGLKRNDEALAAIDKAILMRPADEDFRLFKDRVLKAVEKK